MQQNKKDIGELHQAYEKFTNGIDTEIPEKSKFPYEFLVSQDKGWWPCDVLETDTANELVKIVFHHPDGRGWMDQTGAAGVYDEVVPFWRVKLRED